MSDPWQLQLNGPRVIRPQRRAVTALPLIPIDQIGYIDEANPSDKCFDPDNPFDRLLNVYYEADGAGWWNATRRETLIRWKRPFEQMDLVSFTGDPTNSVDDYTDDWDIDIDPTITLVADFVYKSKVDDGTIDWDLSTKDWTNDNAGVGFPSGATEFVQLIGKTGVSATDTSEGYGWGTYTFAEPVIGCHLYFGWYGGLDEPFPDTATGDAGYRDISYTGGTAFMDQIGEYAYAMTDRERFNKIVAGA